MSVGRSVRLCVRPLSACMFVCLRPRVRPLVFVSVCLPVSLSVFTYTGMKVHERMYQHIATLHSDVDLFRCKAIGLLYFVASYVPGGKVR